jgi:hypothetical protein
MTPTISYGTAGKFDTIILANSKIRAVIIPELGGRVWELEDRLRRRQWIWHRPNVQLQASASGAVYDDVWAGGWEELFPNDAPGRFEGRDLPDHGEWWSIPWHVGATRGGNTAEIRLIAETVVIQTSCTKTFGLQGDEAKLTVRYNIRSHEQKPFHFLFKQHLAIDITPDCRLRMPGGIVSPVDPSFGTLLPTAGPFEWPLCESRNGAVDLQVVPHRSRRVREFIYIQKPTQSWCGVNDLSRKASLRMDFQIEELPYVWLFLSYGGWRNLYTAVLEPCSNLPKDLSQAMRLGQSARLEPNQDFQTSVTVTLCAC